MTTASNLVTASTRPIGTAANNILALDASAKIPAVDGSQLSGLAGSQIVSLSGSASSVLRQSNSIASTSGSSVDFTNIPSWAKRVTINFQSITAAGGNLLFQLGTGAGPTFTTSGYVGVSGYLSGGSSTQNALNFSSGFSVFNSSAYALSGTLTLTNLTGNTWVETSQCSLTATQFGMGSGYIALGAPLTAVRMTNSTAAAFSAGNVNIMWE